MPRSCRSSDVRAASTSYRSTRSAGRPAGGGCCRGAVKVGPRGCHKPGGGYAGFYAAWRLEKKLRGYEARIVVVDPRPYMTYQPFLPEVLAGSVEARAP